MSLRSSGLRLLTLPRSGPNVRDRKIAIKPCLRRAAHGVVDQRLAERPDRAGDLVTGGDDGIERGFDPTAVLFGNRQRRQQLDGVAAVARDLREDLVILEQRHRDELAEQTL